MQEYWRSILRGLKPEIRDSLTLEKALVNREGTRLMVCFHAPGLIVGDDYNDIKRSVRAAFPGREVAVRVSCPELKEQVERDITPYWEFIKNCALRQLPACKPFFKQCTISQTGTSVTVNFPDEAVIAFMLNCKASELLSKLCRELFQANITFDFTCSGEMDERLRYISEMRKKDEQLLMERLALEQKANKARYVDLSPRGMTEYSRNIMFHCDLDAIARIRVENYLRLYDRLSAIPQVRILSKPITAGDGCIPFGLVILVEDRDAFHQAMIRKGILGEIQWILPTQYYTPGEDAQLLSNHNIMLQCDQRYTPADMDEIADTIAAYFS